MPSINSIVKGFAAVAVFAALSIAPANAGTVLLHGSMRTTADLRDQFIFHVPANVPRMTVRVPIPETRHGNVSLTESESIGSVLVESDLPPSSTRDERDSAGNLYRVLIYEYPKPGDYTIDTTLQNIRLGTNLDRSLPRARLPLTNIPDDAAAYLNSSKLVQSSNPTIRLIAAQVTRGATTESDAAARIVAWLQDNIKYGGVSYSEKTDAISTLNNGCAFCEGWSHLFLALARASGIPARFVGGYTLGGSIRYPLSYDGHSTMNVSSASVAHAWVEVWYPGAGWTPYEPQGSAGFVDTHHVPIWSGLDANANLPLLSWNARYEVGRLSFAERERASNINDDIAVEYGGGDAEALNGPVLFSR